LTSILEHSDHRKSGRALAIVSTSYILLHQCSVWFDSVGILGLNVQLTQEDFLLIFGSLRWVYLVIFLFRIIPNIGFDRLHKFRREQHDQWVTVTDIVQVGVFNEGNTSNEVRRAKNISYYKLKYSFLGYLNYFLLLLTEFIPPLVFFFVTWINIQPMICRSFTG
jgi:pilus assembly protein TadC